MPLFQFRNFLDSIGMGAKRSPYMPYGGVQDGVSSTPPITSPNDLPSEFTGMPGGFNPQALEAYRAAVGEMPAREDFQPSVLRRIGAAIAGIGAGGPASMWGGVPVGFKGHPQSTQIAQEVLDKPYNEALTDWKTKIDPLGDAAKLESDIFTEQRIAENQREGRDIQRSGQEITRQRNEEIARHNQSQEALARDRLLNELPEEEAIALRAYYDQKLDEFRQGGRITLRQIDAEIDKELAAIRDRYTKENIGIRDANTKENIGIREQNLRDRPGSTSGTSATQQREALVNKAMDVINARPDLKDFFEINTTNGRPTGVLKYDPPSEVFGLRAGAKAEYDKLYEEAKSLLGSVAPASSASSASPPLERELPNGQTAISTDGGKTWQVKE